ncbi:MAG: CARDB domain-containing protein [bacterium]
MNTIKIFLRSLLILSVVMLPIFIFDSCSFCVSGGDTFCKLFSETPISEITDSVNTQVLYSQDSIVVYDGSGCGKSDKPDTEDMVRLEGSKQFPLFVTDATIFLNGWQLDYLSSDHNVGGLGVAIKNIRLEDSPDRSGTKTLKWEVTGLLSDKNFDDGYNMCYNYTIIAWSNKTMNLTADHDDGSCDTTDPVNSNFFTGSSKNFKTSLSSFKTFLKNPEFASSREVAILPRGFGLAFSGCDVDHRLLQMAYNIDHSEKFIKNKFYRKGSKDYKPEFNEDAFFADSDFVSWETQVIFKDNSQRTYEFGELVSGLGGSDIGIIDPPYTILPNDNDCDGGVGQTSPEEFVVKNIPYAYAVPVLTGWELGYNCDDENIKRVGIKIENWSYTRDPLTGLGTLRYKINSDLFDKNADNSNYRSQNVTILGFKPVAGVKLGVAKTDLQPVIPAGTEPYSFCRRDRNGNLLLVAIKNQGSEDSGPSVTTVLFGTQKISIDTPPIKAGGTVELQFRFPVNCFDPDCEFTIMADSENQINEGDAEKNNSVTEVCKQIIL